MDGDQKMNVTLNRLTELCSSGRCICSFYTNQENLILIISTEFILIKTIPRFTIQR